MDWTYASDMTTAGSLLSMAAMLLLLWRKHRHLPGSYVLTGYAGFMAACGIRLLMGQGFPIGHVITASISVSVALATWLHFPELIKAVSKAYEQQRISDCLATELGRKVVELRQVETELEQSRTFSQGGANAR